MSALATVEPWRDLQLIEARAERHYRPLPFHNFPHHVLDVRSVLVGIMQACRDQGEPFNREEEEDGEIAALYHDAGFFVPVHEHGFRSKETYSIHLMSEDQRELGMPEKRIRRIGKAIAPTELNVVPVTRLGKALRRADLNNVAYGHPLQIVKNMVNIFEEDALLKRKYNHPGEIKTDIINFAINSYQVMDAYNKDDVSLGAFDIQQNGKSEFANRLAQGAECFKPQRVIDLLRKLSIIPDADVK